MLRSIECKTLWVQTTITMMERWFIITILHDKEFGEDDDMNDMDDDMDDDARDDDATTTPYRYYLKVHITCT